MKPSNELFNLIDSLTKSEKRFFKLNSTLQSGEKNYIKIFNFIEKQKKYDEEELKEYFKDEVFIDHLPSEKNHLYKLILKSLRAFYSEQSISAQLKQEIKNVEVLHKKALYRECSKFVIRAKKMAKKYEKFYYWFELISWEKKLLEEAYEDGHFNQDINELIQEEAEVIDKLRNLAEYQVLYSKINLIFKSGGFSRNAEEKKVVSELENYHLIKGKNTAISVRATSICYYIKGLCAASNRDYDEALINFRKVKLVIDKNPDIKMDLQGRYISTLTFLLNCYIDQQDFVNAEKFLNEIKDLTNQKGYDSIDSKVKIFSSIGIGEIQMYNRKGDFEKAQEVLTFINQGLESYQSKLTKEKMLLFNYSKAYSLFGIGDYKGALKLMNLVLNDNEKKLRQDIYSFSRIFNLIIHYELNNFDFVEYEVKSTSRFLNKKEKDYQIEKVFIHYIKKLSKAEFAADKEMIYKAFYKSLDNLLKESNEQVILEYFNIKAWVYSKIKKTVFQEAIKLQL
ncbi:hypothetical protein DNU06_08930 [Putridiphycobacter roseus]|uniref:Tetratricopeptide repeat protein n=1 Tax=Putridiphycobacter roseus TaxID=2219161 RepID=A0A2W1ND83_9FLAO|nr:hypothetical protein [Putridiphycobacter roseus]PZE17385.1 hypothetical protein DNU06_08930 [Putridiphycobacter roseus]